MVMQTKVITDIKMRRQRVRTRVQEFHTAHPGFCNIMGKIFKYSLPVAVTVGLLVWLFTKIHFEDMRKAMADGCNFWWILLMMGITVLSHIIRGIRWGIQLRAVGVPRMSVTAESVAIFGAYALNLVFPWLGEGWRCVMISRREGVPLSTVVGTDLGDRGSDGIVVLLLLCLAFGVAHGAIDSFIDHYAVGRDVAAFTDNPWAWAWIATAILLVWGVLYFFRKYRWVAEADRSLQKVWDGFRVLFTMRHKGWYVVLTIGIWSCYFLETYVCFHAFGFTRPLLEMPGSCWGLIPGLVVFVFGSLSMAVPSNGGLGPWNLAVMFALSLYGVTDAQGAAYSLVAWGFQALTLVMLGIFSAIYLSRTGSDKSPLPE